MKKVINNIYYDIFITNFKGRVIVSSNSKKISLIEIGIYWEIFQYIPFIGGG
jgi:hypothetical protein